MNQLKQETFIVDGLVYCPKEGTELFQLAYYDDGYTIRSTKTRKLSKTLITTSGTLSNEDNPYVYLATEDNKEMLDNIYNKSFEDIPTPLKVLHLTNQVLCITSDDEPECPKVITRYGISNLDLVTWYDFNADDPFGVDEYQFVYATPVSINELGEITTLTWEELHKSLLTKKKGNKQ